MYKKSITPPTKFIIASQYFLYFGVMGIALPYFNLYCYHIGFTGFEIGVLSSLKSVAMVLSPVLWGLIADKYRIRRPLYIFFNISSTFIWSFFLFTTDFFIMSIITIFYSMLYAPIISFLETFTMDALSSEKKRYGTIRMWGTISFISMVSVTGILIDRYATDIIIIMILLGSLSQAMISFCIPKTHSLASISFSRGKNILSQSSVIVFLMCAFLMLVSHGTYYGFFSIHLESLGLDKSFIGITWAIASCSEILVMMNSNWIFKKFNYRYVMIFSFFIATLRWLILSFSQSPIIILMSQIFHAVTYGMFHISSILYIDAISHPDVKTFGQAINNAVTYGLGMMTGFFLSGYFYETIGTYQLFFFSACIAIVGGILLMGFGKMNSDEIQVKA